MANKLYKKYERKHGEFGERLQKIRKQRKIKTQDDFAELLGVSVKSVQYWEQGWKLPETDNLFKIAALLDCDLDYLTGRIDQSTHDLQFIHDQTGLSEDAIKKIIAWNNDDISESVDTRHWIHFLSDMITDKDAAAFLMKLHEGMINENQEQPIAGDYIPQIMMGRPQAFHDSTLYALSRIASDITERIMEKGFRETP